MDYADFLARKAISDPATGLDHVPNLNAMLFDFQREAIQVASVACRLAQAVEEKAAGFWFRSGVDKIKRTVL